MHESGYRLLRPEAAPLHFLSFDLERVGPTESAQIAHHFGGGGIYPRLVSVHSGQNTAGSFK